MTRKPEASDIKVVKLPRMLKSDIRPMEPCCSHHVLAHDATGCLITGCECRKRGSLTKREQLSRKAEA